MASSRRRTSKWAEKMRQLMGTTFDERLIPEVIIRTGVDPAISGGVVSVGYHTHFQSNRQLGRAVMAPVSGSPDSSDLIKLLVRKSAGTDAVIFRWQPLSSPPQARSQYEPDPSPDQTPNPIPRLHQSPPDYEGLPT
ncbi:hypothetical protein V502_04767 [Pseudogymnoascus sp. VKM F-4520 (FW-2644)]|nr:hypothetical protein V502_04767 [Pseudogymnoascus sp. VKM F-4520 (FW-2644)]